jgi:hypothetical protein
MTQDRQAKLQIKIARVNGTFDNFPLKTLEVISTFATEAT